MDASHHIQMTEEALSPYLSPTDWQIVVRANLGQDALANLISRPEVHFDDSLFQAGVAYIEQERRRAVAAIVDGQDRRGALQALGRLLHTRQDFYAHSNWVRLWVAQRGGLERCSPEQIEICLDPLSASGLISGASYLWRYPFYRLPLVGRLFRRFWLPPDSHEAMNLDHPGRGPLFPFAMAAATRHTRLEVETLLAALEAAGGQEAVNRFLGQ